MPDLTKFHFWSSEEKATNRAKERNLLQSCIFIEATEDSESEEAFLRQLSSTKRAGASVPSLHEPETLLSRESCNGRTHRVCQQQSLAVGKRPALHRHQHMFFLYSKENFFLLSLRPCNVEQMHRARLTTLFLPRMHVNIIVKCVPPINIE